MKQGFAAAELPVVLVKNLWKEKRKKKLFFNGLFECLKIWKWSYLSSSPWHAFADFA